MRKFLFILFSILILLLLAIALVPVIYQEELEGLVRAQINKQVEANVSITHFRFSVIKRFPNLTATLEDISIASKKIPGDTLLKASQISLALDTWDLIRRRAIGLKSVFVKNAAVKAWIDRNGKNNFSIIKSDTSSGETKETVSAHIHKIEIENSAITYTDAVSHTTISANQLNGKATGEFSTTNFDLKTDAQAKQVSIEFQGKRYFTNKDITLKLAGNLDMTAGRYFIQESEIAINQFKVNADGKFSTLPDGLSVDCRFKSSQNEFKDVLSLASFLKDDLEGLQTKGLVNFQGYAKGNFKSNLDSVPLFEVHLDIKNASLKMDTIPEVMEDINLDLHLKNTTGVPDSLHIDLDSLHLRIHDHVIQGHAHIHGLKNSGIDANLEGTLHFDELMAVYPIPGLHLEGDIAFTLKALGKLRKEGQGFEVPFVDADFEIEDGKVKYDSLPDSLNNIHLKFHYHIPQDDLQNAELIVDHLEMNVGQNPLTGQLKVKGFVNPEIDAQFNATLNLEDIERVFPMEGIDIRGAFNSTVVIKGVYDKSKNLFPSMNAGLSINNGYFKSNSYPKPVENIFLNADLINTTGLLKSTILNLKRFTYTLDGDPFEVSGVIQDFENYAYDLQVKGLMDIGKLTKVYPVEGYVINGTIRSDVQASGTITDLKAGRYEKTRANGNIYLQDIYLAGDELPQPIRVEKATFNLTPEVITLVNLKAKSGHSDFALKGELTNYFGFFKNDNNLVTASLSLVSDTLDLNDWRAWFSAPESLQDASSDSVKIIRIPARINFNFDSEIRNAKFDDMTIRDLLGTIRLKDGTMKINEAGFNSLNARFQLGGEYDSRDFAHPLFNFDLKIERLNIKKAYREIRLMRELVPAARDAEGFFSIDYQLQGELNNQMFPKTETLKGAGEVHIDEARINGMKIFQQLSKKAKKNELNDPHLRAFSIESEIRNNKLFVKPFSVKVSGWQTEIEGVNDINGTINYLIKVELLPVTKLKIPFNVTGTYDNPQVELGKGHKLPEE